MKKTAALLLSISILPIPAFADATLDDVISRFEAQAVRDGDTANFPEIKLVKGDTTVTMTNVKAQQSGTEVKLMTSDDVRIHAAPHPAQAGEPPVPAPWGPKDFVVRSPSSVLTISEISNTSVSGDLTTPNAEILTEPSDKDDKTLSVKISGLNVGFSLNAEPSTESLMKVSQESAAFVIKEKGVQSTGTLKPISGEFRVRKPAKAMESYPEPFAAISDGFELSFKMNGDGAEQRTTAEGDELFAETGSWDASLDMNTEEIAFSAHGDGGKMETVGGDGKGYSYGDSSVLMKLPNLAAGKDDFRFEISSADVTPNEAAWTVIDPEKKMDRSPVNFDFLMTGTFIQNAYEALTAHGSPLGIIKDIRLDAFDLNGMGASVSGKGQAEIDPQTQGPKTGFAAFTFEGVDGLLKNLTSSGIIKEAEANQARMGIAMFAQRVGDASDDKYEANITIKDGQSTLNGKPVN